MGFHILGLAVSILILLPNLFFFLFPPRNMPELKNKEPLVFTILENIGRFACFLYPIVFGNDVAALLANAFLYIMIACAALYYVCWMRYFLGGREFSLLFKPLWRLPVPMAVFPAVYFLALAILLKSILMGAAALVFTLSHISISFMTWKQVKHKGGAQ
jgi:hypothetical protein